MTDKILVLSTCASPDEAERIGRALVEAKLAACVNVVPGLRSIYRWRGAVEDSGEVLLLLKTRRELFASLAEALRRLHSYEVPECIALPILDGSEAYLGWIDSETR